MAKVLVCETMLRPREVPVPSSKGDGTFYLVIPKTLYNDAICDCPGFQYRGYCRHIDEVPVCEWHRVEESYTTSVTHCPECGEVAVRFELDPEIEPIKFIVPDRWMPINNINSQACIKNIT